MEPASSIIEALGGAAIVADAAGVHRTRVYKWQSPKEKGGTNGLIPSWHIPTLLRFGDRRGIDIRPFLLPPVSEEAPT